MDDEREAHKLVWTLILCILVVFLLGGCSTKQDVVTVPEYVTHLQHPETLPTPDNPGLSIKVITSERIADGEIPDKAYVGFLYNDWLEFAKWMHEYRAHTESLQNGLETYRAQDSRNSELPNDQ